MSPAEIALKTGILDVPVTAAHCVHLSQKDIEIIKEKRWMWFIILAAI